MPTSIQYVLMAGPVAVYCALLSTWHGGRRPKVVAGAVDVALLGFGLGGLILWGPPGQLIARRLFGRPVLLDWLTLTSGYAMACSILARQSSRRLVIYHVEPAALTRAVGAALAEDGRFVRTLSGFEDACEGRGVRVETSNRLRTAVVETHGVRAEALLQRIRPRLVAALATESSPPTRFAWSLIGVSIAALVIPIFVLVLGRPDTRAALRVLLDRIRGQ